MPSPRESYFCENCPFSLTYARVPVLLSLMKVITTGRLDNFWYSESKQAIIIANIIRILCRVLNPKRYYHGKSYLIYMVLCIYCNCCSHYTSQSLVASTGYYWCCKRNTHNDRSTSNTNTTNEWIREPEVIAKKRHTLDCLDPKEVQHNYLCAIIAIGLCDINDNAIIVSWSPYRDSDIGLAIL